MATQALTIRRAEPADLDTVDSLRIEAIDWLASKGLDQWQPDQPRFPTRASAARAIERGVCHLAHDQAGMLVGTITVDDHADPEFWTQAEREEPALYVHRMIVSRQAAGADLRRYYERHGFQHVRTVDLGHRGSGALLQRPTSKRP